MKASVGRVGVIGCGLIGGSIALRLLREKVAISVWDVDPATLRRASCRGLETAQSLAECAEGADAIVIATPPQMITEVGRNLLDHIGADAIVTDVGSTKEAVARDLVTLYSDRDRRFVPGHPMAGKAIRGFAEADANLFEGCTWVICDQVDADPLRRVQQMAGLLGAGRVVIREPRKHDRQVAVVSHLPQLLVTATASHVPASYDAALRELPVVTNALRFCSSSALMWLQIVSSNRSVIREALDDAGARSSTTGSNVPIGSIDDISQTVNVMSRILYDVAMERERTDPGTLELAGPGFRAATHAWKGSDGAGSGDRGPRCLAAVLVTLKDALDNPDNLTEMFKSANRLGNALSLM